MINTIIEGDCLEVMIEYIGEAKDGTQKGTIVSSFHAG